MPLYDSFEPTLLSGFWHDIWFSYMISWISTREIKDICSEVKANLGKCSRAYLFIHSFMMGLYTHTHIYTHTIYKYSLNKCITQTHLSIYNVYIHTNEINMCIYTCTYIPIYIHTHTIHAYILIKDMYICHIYTHIHLYMCSRNTHTHTPLILSLPFFSLLIVWSCPNFCGR